MEDDDADAGAAEAESGEAPRTACAAVQTGPQDQTAFTSKGLGEIRSPNRVFWGCVARGAASRGASGAARFARRLRRPD
eukprot:12635668-Alexandrium_andersonii.AAC.1